MAHIADCMIGSTEYGLNNFIAKELTPQSSIESLPEAKEKFVWRMHQQPPPTADASRKYQLFPVKDKLSLSSGQITPEQDPLLAGQSRIRSKSKEPALLRRRKPSVSDLGPMTTVQEVAMDSPTIPGRPPLLERSISAPGKQWRQNVFGESMLCLIAGPTIEEKEAETSPRTPWTLSSSPEKLSPNRSLTPNAQKTSPKPSVTPPGPKSAKLLKKLIIPIPSIAIAIPESLVCASQHEPEAPEVPPKSPGRVPCGRKSPLPKSPNSQHGAAHSIDWDTGSKTSLSSTDGPSTAPAGLTGTKPWDTPISTAPTSASPEPPAVALCGIQSEQTTSRAPQKTSHRREHSESSIMDRGRPKKRSATGTVRRRSDKEAERQQASPSLSARELTDEEKAFATLPTGVRANDAGSKLDAQEMEALRRQAIGQAAKFDVLTSRDVDMLSRELGALDERCEYLRITHRSLRAGRRSLHDRICSYLRSPRVARFSPCAILKQEEALAELDASIDDWVSKLEQAENRRTRVRQKLLEHVAAALTIPSPSSPPTAAPNTTNSNKNRRCVETRHDMSTPPRSPSKPPSSCPSPPRSPAGVTGKQQQQQQQHHHQNPQSTQRLAERVRVASPERHPRVSLQSIKIYADSDVYVLLADVEEEFDRMSELERTESPVEESRCKSPFGLLTSAIYEAEKACCA